MSNFEIFGIDHYSLVIFILFVAYTGENISANISASFSLLNDTVPCEILL